MSAPDLRACFAEQARLHVALQPQDALKLAYQAAFGAEHLLSDPGYVRKRLYQELVTCPREQDIPLVEQISPEICRVNLSPWRAARLPEGWLLGLFVHSCKPRKDGEARFYQALEALDQLAAEGALPFPVEVWRQARTDYLSQGIRPVHHSDAYHDAEAPAYRVVEAHYTRLIPLLRRVCPDRSQIIALDGRSASGKTTLAADLSAVTGAAVIHMDDFFLPPALRTAERLAVPGGNVHYERFIADVLPHLKEEAAFSYPRFDCGIMALNGEQQVPAGALRIVEGAYSCHPALGDYMTLRAFSDIDPAEQQRRILARNGPESWERFRTRWIPLEEAYFEAYRLRERADLLL